MEESRMRVRKSMLVVILIVALGQIAQAQDHWVTTWAASPQQPRVAPGGGGGGGAAAPTTFNDQTIRMVVHTTLGGRRARVTLSNAYGNVPLKISSAHVALRDKESAITAGSDRELMFNGKSEVTIAPSAHMISDPVDINIPQLGDVAVS